MPVKASVRRDLAWFLDRFRRFESRPLRHISLLAEYLLKERQRRTAQAKVIESTVALWNRFAEDHGSFADDHSTL